MHHFYKRVHGWMTFEQLYTEMVNKFDNATFVEVGTWKGQSAAYMGVEIINSKKNIKFYCIDPWTGETNDSNPRAYDCMEKINNSLYECFLENVDSIKSVIHPIRMKSVEASENFEDNSIDFVFIDASHNYEDVLIDIKTWYPKVKNNGVIAGHDYHHQEVKRAVDEFCKDMNINLEDLKTQYSWKISKN